ncbi:hypothetical protein ABH917_001891 [Thermobifida halotolerans]|uniref:hypothetical protein n=1 Tax=Thermobifida halotolerans TaxID=483545 RepID=UPI000AAC19CE|nr:hypothetical protein [Thermobifida halotolerans]
MGGVVRFPPIKELDERAQARHLLHVQRCAPGPAPIVCDKGFAGAKIENAAAGLGHPLIRPVRADEPEPEVKVFPSWLRQRIEAIIWTLKNQLRLERHNARTTEGLWARVCQRICALSAVTWHNWLIGAPRQTLPDRLRPLTNTPTTPINDLDP